MFVLQPERKHGVQCVTPLGNCRVCYTVRAVGSTIMMPVLRSVPHHFSGQVGSVPSARCARPAGMFECFVHVYVMKLISGALKFWQIFVRYSNF